MLLFDRPQMAQQSMRPVPFLAEAVYTRLATAGSARSFPLNLMPNSIITSVVTETRDRIFFVFSGLAAAGVFLWPRCSRW